VMRRDRRGGPLVQRDVIYGWPNLRRKNFAAQELIADLWNVFAPRYRSVKKRFQGHLWWTVQLGLHTVSASLSAVVFQA